MPTTRITYHELSPQIRAAIEDVTGLVESATSAGARFNSAVAARLRTASGDRFACPGDQGVASVPDEADRVACFTIMSTRPVQLGEQHPS